MIVLLHWILILYPAHIPGQCFWTHRSQFCFPIAVKCCGLWHCGALLLTLDPWKLFSVLHLGLMDKAESIDAPSPETLISLSLFLSMLLLGLIDSLQWLWSDCLISVTSKPGRGETIDLFANNGNVSNSSAYVGHAKHIIHTKYKDDYSSINYNG